MTTLARESHFVIGSLVHARGRDWVVLPGTDAELVLLRPLGGGDDDIAGVLPDVEEIRPATFADPSPEDLGDDRSARLLREALRIGFRSSGGPFRCLAGLGVSPRPYQLVPLLLALRQETVRLLIADDVGVGKTIEAGLIAAELLAQGSARRLSVLCPPSLAEQWRAELAEKFGLAAVLVLPGSVTRLERELEFGQSVFERHPITVVSTDFVKGERRRNEFLRAAPELVIVDEAHGCVSDDIAGRGGRTQRYRLVRDLASAPDRHLVLVTATPHSGNDVTFRNLIGLIDPQLKDVDLGTDVGRRRLADHMVQRRRADIRSYLGAGTKFPADRLTVECAYKLTPEHRAFFDDVLRYVRGRVQDRSGTKLQQRIRWWSALSLLRSLASSPAAAAATLGTRSAALAADSVPSADAVAAAEVLDQVEDDSVDGGDAAPGAVLDEESTGTAERRALQQFRQRALDLAEAPAQDAKLTLLIDRVRSLLVDGFDPIVFCRFIPTAHYVHERLSDELNRVTVEVVTGELASDERALRVSSLAERAAGQRKVLVATDCLSEGINLQQEFQAVVHYDLAWNPTRHEQREGRVDRFGQPRDVVRALLIYGEDTGIDGIVLDVLLRKHEAIRRDLGISVPVPAQSDQVLAALLEGVLMRGRENEQLVLDIRERDSAADLDEQWRSSAESERRSRSRFAQATIRPEEVQAAVEAAQRSLGVPADVDDFVRTALEESGAAIIDTAAGFTADVGPAPVGLRDAIGRPAHPVDFVRDLPAPRRSAVLTRTDPTVASIARYVLDSALDPALSARERAARRCGLVVTDAVTRSTVILLVRLRTQLTLPGRQGTQADVTEEARVLGFTGPPTEPVWLPPDEVEELLLAIPTGNVPADIATNVVRSVIEALPQLTPELERTALALADELREAHVAVRRAARGDRAGGLGLRGLEVTPQLPVDILGVYVYRPSGGAR